MKPQSEKAYGILDIPIIDIENNDPRKRAYYSFPTAKRNVPQTYPLVDFRSEVFSNDGSSGKESRAFLDTYGFTAVKHISALSQLPYTRADYNNVQSIEKTYWPEIKALVRQSVGASKGFIISSAIRAEKLDANDADAPNSAKEKPEDKEEDEKKDEVVAKEKKERMFSPFKRKLTIWT
jgi:hypothetical protein